MEDQNKEINVEEDKDVSNLEGHTTDVPSTKENSKEEVKTFTQEEVNKIIEKRLAKEMKKREKALQEAERLSKMSDDERARAEFESEKEAFENERKAYLKDKMLTQCEKELIKESLPSEFAHLLVTDDADSTSDNIKAFKEQWNKALEEAVNERLKSKARVPKKETTDNSGDITWEDVLKDSSLLKKYKEQKNIR